MWLVGTILCLALGGCVVTPNGYYGSGYGTGYYAQPAPDYVQPAYPAPYPAYGATVIIGGGGDGDRHWDRDGGDRQGGGGGYQHQGGGYPQGGGGGYQHQGGGFPQGGGGGYQRQDGGDAPRPQPANAPPGGFAPRPGPPAPRPAPAGDHSNQFQGAGYRGHPDQ